MKITNDGISSTTPQTPASATPATSRESEAAPPPASDTVYTPSAEWMRLLNQLSLQPDVRPDRVEAALARLQRGDYLSPESAAKTAEAMLNAQD